MAPRRLARTVAFQLTFALVTNPTNQFEPTLDLIGESSEYGVELFLKIKENMSQRLSEIKPHLKGWTIDRISPVDKAILLIGIEEIKSSEDVPFKVAIDEAIHLAKTFGLPESTGFINAVLDKFKTV